MYHTSLKPVVAIGFAKCFRVLLPIVLSIVLTANSANAQKFEDSILVNLENFHRITKNTRCVINVATVGTHPDPLGTGGGYTYVWYHADGKRRTDYNSNNVAAWVGINDEPGNLVSMTMSYNSSDSPGECNYGYIGEMAGGLKRVLHAHYTTSGGPVAFYRWKQSKGLSVNFDGSESYVATITGHKPITSYLWTFDDGGTSSGVAPEYTFKEAGTYQVMLQVFDDKGKIDTCVRTVEVKAALLSVRARIEEERADKGDTLTVIGIIENVGSTNVSSIVAGNSFSMVFEFPDSVLSATLTDPVITPFPTVPLSILEAVLAPGQTFEVKRQYAVSQLGKYRTASMDDPEDISVQVKASLIELVGEDPAGEPVRVIRPCDKDGTASGCERNHAVIGSVGVNFVVNSIENTGDENAGDGKCGTGKMIDVNGKMVPECTLRAAIEEANASAGPQKITFKIPGTGVKTIKPTGSALPPITDRLTLDATTQTGYNGSPLIFLDGSEAGVNASGLRVNLSEENYFSTRIEGFAIGNFGWYGMHLIQGRELFVELNRIGTTASGTAAAPNKNGGIYIQNATVVIRECLISANDSFGVRFGSGPSDQPSGSITGSNIGTTANGKSALGNKGPGIVLRSKGSSLFIGGETIEERNIVSGNDGDGIFLEALEGSVHSWGVIGSFIGTDITGTKKLQNSGNGIHLRVSKGSHAQVEIRRPKYYEGDDIRPSLISGNLGHGIYVEEDCDLGSCDQIFDQEIYGNYIGTDITGKKAIGNGGSGIFIKNVSNASVSSNLISSNASGIVAEGYTGGNTISIDLNLIGTDITHTANLGNKGDGIRLKLDKTILGAIDGPHIYMNTIVTNHGNGIAILGNAPSWVAGNRIGITFNESGKPLELGNREMGVLLGEQADDNVIGWGQSFVNTIANQINHIAYNTHAGIMVKGGVNQNLRGNILFHNGGELNTLGIDLGGEGVTPNDETDDDEGPNDLTNTPVIKQAYLANGEIYVKGYMAGRPYTLYSIDFYTNLAIPDFRTPVQGYVEEIRVRTSLLLSSNDGNGEYIDSFATSIASIVRLPANDPDDILPTTLITSGASISSISTFASTSGGFLDGTTSEFSNPLLIRNAPTVTEATMPGDIEMEVSDSAGYRVGDSVIICPACPNEERATVDSLNSLIFKYPLQFAHAVGEAIVPFARSNDTVMITKDTTRSFHSGTSVAIKFVGTTGGGTVSAERFRRAPKDLDNVADSSVLPHRWVVGQDSTLTFNDSTEIRFRLSGIPNLVLDTVERTAERLNVYHRPTPGSGSFMQLPTRYDRTTGTIGATGFTSLGEFVLAKDRPLGIQTGRDTKIPSSFSLSVAYPNPFSATTSLTLAMPQSGEVAVVVLNSLGQQVALLHNGPLSVGTHTVQFDARNLPSGVYFIQAKSQQGGYTRQVLYMP